MVQATAEHAATDGAVNDLIERAARAIYASRNGSGCKPWSLLPKAHKAPYLSDARAAISAMRDPTPEMRKAGRTAQYSFDSRFEDSNEDEIWSEMITAALGTAER